MKKNDKEKLPNVTVTFNNNGAPLIECMKNIIRSRKISDKILN